MTFNPTPPTPITTTLLPGWTLAVFTTEPKPVITPQPTMQAEVNGTSTVSGVTASLRTSVKPESVPMLKERSTGRPRHRVPSGCACPREASST